MKGVYALTEDIKKEDVKEEEVAETTEEVVEESNQPSELEEAQARAENLKINTFVLMQKCKTFSAVPMKERQQLQKYRSQDLGKSDLTITGQSRTCPCRRRADR